MRNLFRNNPIPMDVYPVPPDFDETMALAFTRESAPPAWIAVMRLIQDEIADREALVVNMATARDHGYLAHSAGGLEALIAVYNQLEQKRAEAMTERL